MEINPNNKIAPAVGLKINPIRVQARPAGLDTASFARVEALNQALRATPTVRPEKTAMARQLLGDVKYPPDEIIRGIVSLFAMSVDDPPSK